MAIGPSRVPLNIKLSFYLNSTIDSIVNQRVFSVIPYGVRATQFVQLHDYFDGDFSQCNKLLNELGIQ